MWRYWGDDMLINMVLPGAVETARLPKEYQEVEYIQSSGTQYIDTGVSPSTNLITQVDFIPDSSAMSEHAIFGSTWSANGYFMMFYQNKLRWHSSGKSVDVSAFNANTENNIVCSRTGLNVNGTMYAISPTGTDSTNTVYIFATQGNMSGNKGIYKLKYFAMSLNGALVREFIPCYRKLDNVAGLYDLVSSAFYNNAGTGAFIAGPKVSGTAPPSSGESLEFTYSGNYTDNRTNGKGTVRLNTSGTLIVTSGAATVLVSMLGGGGGGAAIQQDARAAAGGSGGFRTVEVELTQGTYSITIGTGGAGNVAARDSGYSYASSGGDTTAFGYTSTGGAGGQISGAAVTAGSNGTPNGGNINGGTAGSSSATSGGDGYVELTFI